MHSEAIAEICGAITGDGWIEARGSSLYVCGDRIEDKEYYDKNLVPLFSRNFFEVHGKIYPYWQVYGFGLHRRKIIEQIVNLGVIKGKKVYVCGVPEWVFTEVDFMRGFLRGLFDTDGCIFFGKSYDKYSNEFKRTYHHDVRLRISSSSPALIQGVEHIGKRLGIEFTSIRKRAGKPTLTKNNGDSYIIELNKRTQLYRWFHVLRLSSNPKHTSKYEVWRRFGFCPSYTTLIERKKILNSVLNPYVYYAGVPERSNGAETCVAQPQV